MECPALSVIRNIIGSDVKASFMKLMQTGETEHVHILN